MTNENMPETLIVPYKAAYLDEIVKLEEQCFSVPWSRNSLQEVGESENHIFFVILHKVQAQTDIWGLGCVSVIAGEGELLNIAVSPDHRREGLGQWLLGALLEEAKERGVERLFLEVREGNAPARGLYERNGFQMIGKRKRYYRNPPEDAILMERC